MENLPQASSSPLRGQSTSLSLVTKTMIPPPQRASPRPPSAPSPHHRKARSSPLTSRSLSALNNAPRTPTPEKSSYSYAEEESIHVSPVQLKYAHPPQLLPPKDVYQKHRASIAGQQPPPPPQTPTESVATSNASYCSTPSSTFMELIYSASASTSATPDVLATPEIFRVGDEHLSLLELQQQQQQPTPLIKNTNTRASSAVAAPSPSSTLQSMQSMTPRNQQHVRAEWWVPRINTTNVATSNSDNQASGSLSPFSLPSMLGAPSAEEISELDSPMLLDFQPSAEESDIQSQSQATDINSMKTITPVARPLVRCNAHDEDDLHQPSKASAVTPTLTQLASGSALCVSRDEVVAASYEFYDDTDSELSDNHKVSQPVVASNTSSVKNETTLQRDTGGIIPEQSAKTRESYTNGNRVTSRLFFRSSIPTPSPKTQAAIPPSVRSDPYNQWQGDGGVEDGDISELSSHYASSKAGDGDDTPLPSSENILPIDQAEGIDNQAPTSTDGLSSNIHKVSFADSRCGVILRLIIIIGLALAVVIPLAIVLIHVRNQSNANIVDEIPSASPIVLSEEPSPSPMITPEPSPFHAELSTDTPTALPSSLPQSVTMSPSATPQSITPVPTAKSSTMSPSQQAASPTEMPVATEPPTMPPYTAIWVESTWSTATIRFGPVWPTNGSGTPLELTVFNSLTNPDDWSTLEAVVQDWDESSTVNLNLESSSLYDDECPPTLGAVRICNGSYGNNQTKFFSNVYVNDREIIAVTVFVNDDVGLETLTTDAALRYNLCHEIGHALGLFHSSRGCMVERLTFEDGQSSYLSPDAWNFAELDRLYGSSRRHLRR